MPIPVIVFLSLAALLLLLFLLFILSTRPNKPRADAAYFATFSYAHRGLHDAELPENSLAAFDAAARAGYAIELDVQLSRDGVPMVFHDASLARVCGVEGNLCDYTAEELSRMPLSGKSAHTIPTFAAVLATVGGRVPLLVEIKGTRHITPVCEAAMRLLDTYEGRFCVESFSPYAVHWFRKNRPHIIRGQLSERFWLHPQYRVATTLAVELLCTNFLTRPDFIAYNVEHRRAPGLWAATRLWHAKAFAWTVRTAEDEEAAGGFFDCLIFENIQPAKRKEHDETETGSDLSVRT